MSSAQVHVTSIPGSPTLAPETQSSRRWWSRNGRARSAAPVGRLSQASPVTDASAATRPLMTLRESLKLLIFVYTVTVLRGFTFGMLAPLNKHFQDEFHISKGRSALVQVSQALGTLLVAPTIGRWCVHRFGYRRTFAAGLATSATGMMLFFPAGKYESFGLFCFATAVISAGYSAVELSTLPFVLNSGPARWADVRMNLSPAFFVLGDLGGLLIVSFLVYQHPGHDAKAMHDATRNLMFLALGNGIGTMALGAVCMMVKLPEYSDKDLAAHLEGRSSACVGREPKCIWRNQRLWFGFVAMFCYTGASSSMITFYVNYLIEVVGIKAANAVRYMAVGVAANIAGRLFWIGAMRYMKARYILLCAIFLGLIFQIPVVAPIGVAGLVCLLIDAFVRGPIHPTTWSLTLRGLGANTKTGASILTTADTGGVLWTPIMGLLADYYGVRVSVAVPIVALSLTSLYPIWLNVKYGKFLDELSKPHELEVAGSQPAEHGNGAAPAMRETPRSPLPAVVAGDDRARQWSEATSSSVNSVDKAVLAGPKA